MNRRKHWIIAVALSALAVGLGQSGTTPQPSPETAGLAEQRAEVWKTLKGGQFEAGDAALDALLEKYPQDSNSVQAKELLDEYLARRAEDEKARQAEHAATVARAEVLLKIAQAGPEFHARLEAARPLVRPLRQTVIDMLAAPASAATYDSGEAFLTQLLDDALQADQKIDEIVRKVCDRPDSRPATSPVESEDPNEAIVRDVGARARAAVAAFKTVAQQQKWGDTAERVSGLRATRNATDEAGEALDDFIALFSETPWRVMLDRARLAKETAADKAKFLQEPWVQAVEQGASKQAEADAKANESYKALALYDGLENLQETNAARQAYRQRVHEVTRRARVVARYGPPLETAEAPDDDEEPQIPTNGGKWENYVRQVDAKMVKDIIDQFDRYYVDNVDYRKMLIGALESLRILAEAPGLATTFAGLGDEKAKGGFLAAIENEINEARRLDIVGPLNVKQALTRCDKASKETIKLPPEVIYVEFANGLMDPLDDFSSILWPSDWPDFKKQTMGHFSGVGIQINMENGLLKVVTPLEGSPAYDADIRAGDYIIAIDGKTAEHIELDEAVGRISGPEGSRVVLTIRRPGVKETFDKTLVRADIKVKTVKGWKRSAVDWDWVIDPQYHIGYIRVSSFTNDTIDELRSAIAELKGRDVRGLVIDLRYNPGGSLRGAIDVADAFLREGRIVSTKGRQQPQSEHAATRGGAYTSGEIVVLVNRGSASASEIVSGALSDLGRATIVGERSFGKGSVQNLLEIRPDSAYLKLTTAYYYLPNGRCLHRTKDSLTWGVEPDVAVTTSPEQRRKWLELRRDADVLQSRTLDALNGMMDEQLRLDGELDTALLLLRLKLMEPSAVAAAPSPATGSR